MQSSIRIENRNDCCFVDIEGVIGTPEAWQFDEPASRVATYDKFRKNLELLREIESPEVVVNIRSTGGDVNDALLIYEALASLSGRIVTRCYGYTASAATVIAQAASPGGREISAHALYLIHNSICATEGNAGELAARIDLLRRTDERLAALYASRSGRPAEEFAALMGENNGQGRWLSAEEALATGLVDRIVDAAAPHEESPRPATAPAARWRRLLGRFGRNRPAEGLPEDRNILHFDDPEPGAQLSALRFDEGQRRVQPTATLPCEDPSVGDRLRTPNELAYAADARRMTR